MKCYSSHSYQLTASKGDNIERVKGRVEGKGHSDGLCGVFSLSGLCVCVYVSVRKRVACVYELTMSLSALCIVFHFNFVNMHPFLVALLIVITNNNSLLVGGIC